MHIVTNDIDTPGGKYDRRQLTKFGVRGFGHESSHRSEKPHGGSGELSLGRFPARETGLQEDCKIGNLANKAKA
jgi:hypothetical protein